MQGEVIGSYRVVAKVGDGQSTSVYLAEHTLMGRRAVIKMFPADSTSGVSFDNAQRVATLTHPSLVEVFDFGQHFEQPYLVMEHLDGHSLAEHIREHGRIPVSQALRLAQQISEALAVIHDADLAHGALNPGNIFLLRDPTIQGGQRAKLLDTGMVGLSSRAAGESDDPQLDADAVAYLAPEQLKTDPDTEVDHRAEFYALGCILFEMVCGRPPYVAEASGDLAAQHIYGDPPSARAFEPTVTEPLEQVFEKLLAKSPDQRPQTTSELIQALDLKGSAGASKSGAHPSLSFVNFDSAPIRSAESVKIAAAVDEKPSQARLIVLAILLIITVVGALSYIMV